MGCTSSAPNMAKSTPRANSADSDQGNHTTEAEDTSKQIEMDANMDNETKVANVLPKTCDKLVLLTELDRRNKTLLIKMKPDQENGLQSTEQEIINEKISVDEKEDGMDNSTEDKLSKLEEVVEKVVELYIADKDTENLKAVLMDDTYPAEDSDSSNNTFNATEQSTDEVDPVETKSVTCAEESSADVVVEPGRSPRSRATRWEALADVAAELPPSLAMDPLTGQIYALSK